VIEKCIRNVVWGKINELKEIQWNLYLLFYDQSKKRLYVNSNVKGNHYELCSKIVPSATIIMGETIFKCFHNVNRLILHTVGLRDAFYGQIRYKMYAGLDISAGLADAVKRTAIKSNIFGLGYEGGKQISIGCSYKGKIWSKEETNILNWKKWCDQIGNKVTNGEINVDEILKGVLCPQIIKDRPRKVPIYIEWPTSFYTNFTTSIRIKIKDKIYEIDNVSLRITNFSVEGPIEFVVETEDTLSKYNLIFIETDAGKNYSYINTNDCSTYICKSDKEILLEEYFCNDAPIIQFCDNSYLENNIFIDAKKEQGLIFNVDKIETWAWEGVNIKKESQRLEKRKDSIQYNLIKHLKEFNYQIIFDDDNSGEVADVITIYENENVINVELYHCKFSSEENPGARVTDLYEVCGQAEKSIRWKEDIYRLFDHMRKREMKRIRESKNSRFEVGNLEVLHNLRKKAKFYKYSMKIFIVQPGLSKSEISDDQKEILAATEAYLYDTYKIQFGIIASK